MKYFTDTYVQFFTDLASNNHKEWFDNHRKIYEEAVKKPFYKLVQDVIQMIAQTDNQMQLQVKDAVFRINKDIRFSKDKTPYKLHMAAVCSHFGRKKLDDPGLYLQIGLDGIKIGGGMYCPTTETLTKLRQGIINHESLFLKTFQDKKFQAIFKDFAPCERNKTLPKEYKTAAERLPILYNKHFYFMKDYPASYITKDNLLDFIEEHHKASQAMTLFIKEAVS